MDKAQRAKVMREMGRYRAWRASIPFTNEQIVAAMREDIRDFPHRHQPDYRESWIVWFLANPQRLSSKMFRLALPHLIKVCAICGKTATRRLGTEGRCEAHRGEGRPAYMGRCAKRSAAISAYLDEEDRVRRRGERLHNARDPRKSHI